VKELLNEFPKTEDEIEKEEEKVGKCRNMMSDIMDNSRLLFVSPILKFTLISITINFTFHIGYDIYYHRISYKFMKVINMNM
jgi:VNT family MFS transporter (synaptic vesicle glycoprotein 2)